MWLATFFLLHRFLYMQNYHTPLCGFQELFFSATQQDSNQKPQSYKARLLPQSHQDPQKAGGIIGPLSSKMTTMKRKKICNHKWRSGQAKHPSQTVPPVARLFWVTQIRGLPSYPPSFPTNQAGVRPASTYLNRSVHLGLQSTNEYSSCIAGKPHASPSLCQEDWRYTVEDILWRYLNSNPVKSQLKADCLMAAMVLK